MVGWMCTHICTYVYGGIIRMYLCLTSLAGHFYKNIHHLLWLVGCVRTYVHGSCLLKFVL